MTSSKDFTLEVYSLDLIQALQFIFLRLPSTNSGWLKMWKIGNKLFLKRELSEEIYREIDIPCKGDFSGEIIGPWPQVAELARSLKLGTIQITGGYSDKSWIKFNNYIAYSFWACTDVTTNSQKGNSTQEIFYFNYPTIDISTKNKAVISNNQSVLELSKYIEEIDKINSDNPPARIEELALMFERDSRLVSLIKAVRGNECQICGYTFSQTNGDNYSELHHLEHLADGGLDVANNLIVLCANHHRQFHYGKVKIIVHTQDRIVIELDGKIHECQI